MTEQGILLKSGTNEMELLSILVDDQPFGINVAKVQSLQKYDPALVTGLPHGQPGVLGMLLYRDRTIPLMDLSEILDIRLTNMSDREIVVVTEFNNAVNGFKVQSVDRIYRLSWDKLVPMAQTLGNSNYFTGSVNVADKEILVLDLEHIISNIFPDLIIENVSEQNLSKIDNITREDLDIIFADDSPTIRKGVTKALKSAGFTNIAEFFDGSQALEYVQKNYGSGKRAIENVVLISDIEMPQMDGLTLCKNIKQDKILQDIFVIMFSSLINKQMIAKCQNVKADTYVTKPETNHLIELLDKRCT